MGRMSETENSSSFFIKMFQVVQEYERVVIFRLGRLMPGGAKGPGLSLNLTIYLALPNTFPIMKSFSNEFGCF